jgi:hypothetical protein
MHFRLHNLLIIPNLKVLAFKLSTSSNDDPVNDSLDRYLLNLT